MRANAEASFAHLEALVGAKSLSEVVELQTSFLRQRVETAVEQAKEFQAVATKAADDVVQADEDRLREGHLKKSRSPDTSTGDPADGTSSRRPFGAGQPSSRWPSLEKAGAPPPAFFFGPIRALANGAPAVASERS